MHFLESVIYFQHFCLVEQIISRWAYDK